MSPEITHQKGKKIRPSSQQKIVLSAPPKLDPETRSLFARGDYLELEYRRIEEFKQAQNLTAEQRRAIKEHDAVERRIVADPDSVIREAHEAIDHGVSLLLKLIRSRRLTHSLEPTEKGRAEGFTGRRWDRAFECFKSRQEYMNQQAVRLASIGVPQARRSIFYQAKVLAESFIGLAQAYPEDFREAAESSLTMPSIRSRNSKFSADAAAIAQAIHLGEKHPVSDVLDNRGRIGGLCHYMVANFVSNVVWERESYQREEESLKGLQEFYETAEKYAGITLDEWLRGHYYPTTYENIVAAAGLPDLHEDPEAWWKGRILPMVREEFENLSLDPARNAALWSELQRGTDEGTVSEKRRFLEKNCHNKLHQIAKKRP